MSKTSNVTIILAAGKSTRIQQLSFDRPKTLLSVNGQSLLLRLCLMLIPYSDKIVIVAGENYRTISEHVAELDMDIEIITESLATNCGNASSLRIGLDAVLGDYRSITIVESDVIFTKNCLSKFFSNSSTKKFIAVSMNVGKDDDKIYFDEKEKHYMISKTIKAKNSIGKFVGISMVSREISNTLRQKIPRNSMRPYVEYLCEHFNVKSYAILIAETEAMEIDTGDDYRKALCNPSLSKTLSSEKYCFRNKGFMNFFGSLKRIVGVYDLIGAKLVQRVGFDGLWMEIPPINNHSGKDGDTDHHIEEAFSFAFLLKKKGNILPVLIETKMEAIETYGFKSFIEKCIQCNIGAICIDDKGFSSPISLVDRKKRKTAETSFIEKLSSIIKYTENKIQIIGIVNLQSTKFCENEFLSKLNSLQNVGTSALAFSYIDGDFKLLCSFVKKYKKKIKIPIISLLYNSFDIPINHLKSMGCAAIVYKKLDLRIRVNAMLETYSKLSANTALDKTYLQGLPNFQYLKDILE